MKNINIGFDAKRMFHNATGLGNYSKTLVEHLAAQYPDNYYHLFTPYTDQQFRYLDDPDYRVLLHTHRGYSRSLWRSFGIYKDIDTAGIDLYHGLSNEIPFTIHRTKAKSVVTIHDVIFKIYPAQYPLTDRIIYNIKTGYACKNADKVIAISESTKNDLIRYYKVPESKIEVVFQACDPMFGDRKTDEQKSEILGKYGLPQKFILYVGTINERKNLLNVVKAMELIPENDRLPLVAIGQGGTYKNKVMHYIANNNLSRWITVKETVNRIDLPAIYQSASFFIFPSLYEGFGLPVIEAIWAGIPVITSDISSLPEAAGPGAIYVDPSDPHSIAGAVIKLNEDLPLRRDLATKGLAYIKERYNGDALARQMMGVYQKLL